MTTADKKFVIGLTGNIATGKSVVRKMLEHLGAYGIDADALSHRAIGKGAPGYQPVVDHFGKSILDDDGNIDRARLGALVFSDPSALKKLEEIIHPSVRSAVAHLIKKSPHKVVVVEAVKLLESDLRSTVDTVWVTVASEANQIARLARHRGMSEDEARARMSNQSPQKEKITAASIVIDNNHSIEDTWNQVREAWVNLFHEDAKTRLQEPSIRPHADGSAINLTSGDLLVSRAGPEQAADIANFINQLSKGSKNLKRGDVMAAFGEKAYMILSTGNQMVGVVGWQVENLVARVDEVWLYEKLNLAEALKALIPAIEEASRQLQAEVALVFVSPILAKQTNIWSKLGYYHRTADELSVDAWKEAALETMDGDMLMLFKRLRADRVLRPI
jgi:dephospho-CoA kinase